MVLPTLAKTWQFDVNQIQPAYGTHVEQARDMLYRIKQSLISFSSNPWVVIASCNGSTIKQVGDPSPDLWTSPSAISTGWTTSAYPWIVLRQPATGWTLCWQGTTVTYPYQGYVYGSWTTFNADGTTSAAPTATGRSAQISNAVWGIRGATNTYTLLHILHATDGTATRILMCRSGATTALWSFERSLNAPAFWSGSALFRAVADSSTTTVTTTSNLGDGNTRAWNAAGEYLYSHYAVEVAAGTNVTSHLKGGDDATGEMPFASIPIVVSSQGGRGVRGNAVDMWYGSEDRPTGTTYPDDGSRQFAQFGHIILPWNGTDPRTA